VVTHQLQVERRTAKDTHRPKTDALPLDHITNLVNLNSAATWQILKSDFLIVVIHRVTVT